MRGNLLRIGLAAARNAPTVAERLAIAEQLIAEGARRSVAIVCFPEAYLPGLRTKLDSRRPST
jgi:predicted amidohydrolase